MSSSKDVMGSLVFCYTMNLKVLWSLMVVVLNVAVTVCTASVSSEQPLQPHHAVADKLTIATTTSSYTVAPSDTVQYVMNLTSSGLAALDSMMFFEVELMPNGTGPDPSQKFLYKWMNMADKRVLTTSGGLRSSVTVTFSSKNVTVGDYLMTVAAYPSDKPTTIVAYQTEKFTLTDNLNGMLLVTQNLSYQRNPDIFSTGSAVTMMAQIYDRFSQTGLKFEHFWYMDKRFLKNTKQPNCTTFIADSSNVSLASLIFIHNSDLAPNVQTAQNGSNTGKTLAALSGMTFGNSLTSDTGTNRKISVKYINTLGNVPVIAAGIFQRTVTFKEPVHTCYIVRVDGDHDDRSINMKETVLVNVSCYGSTPSSLCTNITDVGRSLDNHTCQPHVFVDKLDHLVEIRLPTVGWNDVHFFAYNDVSRYHIVESFYGYYPDSINVPALTLPLVFGILGIVVVVVGGMYLVRLRKKPLVEVADFDFHPSLTSSQSQGRFQFSRVTDTIKSMFSRNRYETDHTRYSLRKPATYARSDADHFYESL